MSPSIPPLAADHSSRIAATVLAALLSAVFPASAHDIWDFRSSLSGGNQTNPTRAVYAGSRFLQFSGASAGTYWHSEAGTAGWQTANLPDLPSNFAVNGAATGNGKVVVTGQNNTLYWTTEASVAGLPDTPVSWTKLNPVTDRESATPHLYGVRFLNNQFIAGVHPFTGGMSWTYYNEFLTSPDGETWTSRKIMASAVSSAAFTPRDFAFKPGTTPGGGTWVAVGNLTNGTNGLFTFSEDFSTGSRITSAGALGTTQRVVFADGKFVMVTANGRLLTSADGSTWTERTLPVQVASLNDVFFDGARFVAVGGPVSGSSPSRPGFFHSTDGENWQEAASVPFTTNAFVSVIRADGLWLATSGGRNVFTSGRASVFAPEITAPSSVYANAGDTVTLSVTVESNPEATIEWLRNNVTLADGPLPSGAVVSGATSSTLTITGITLADAGNFSVRATNSIGTTTSGNAALGVSLTAGGAVLTPYGAANTGGGTLIPGASPAKVVVGSSPLATFTVGSGFSAQPNTFVNPANYSMVGGTNPSGTKVLLGASSENHPLMVYDLAAQSGTVLPAIPLPLGPVAAINLVMPIALAENGDATGIIQDNMGQNRGFHYSAATSTYTLLGNVPNANNDIASNPGGISADGKSISGYERTGAFDGPFIWTTDGGFTLLPYPHGSLANGDVRDISPNGRWITGFGTAFTQLGGGQIAMRWDRGLPHGTPSGRVLQKRAEHTFADGITINDDGTAGGTVRQGGSHLNSRAAVWLPSGALVVLHEYLAEKYSLTLTGFTLTHVTSISDDRRTLSGSGLNATNQTEGWILTLPEPLAIENPLPDITVVQASTLTNGQTVNYGSKEVDSPGVSQRIFYVRNDGSAPLTGMSVAVSGANSADFSILLEEGMTSFPAEFDVSEHATLDIRFHPQPGAAGTRTATLTFTSNDPDENPFTVQLMGTAVVSTLTPAQTALLDYLTSAGVPEGKRGALDDADGDGLPNLLEFALGLPPMQPGTLPPAQLAGGYLELTYMRAREEHVDYVVVTSPDLGAGAWSPDGVEQGTPDGNGVTTARIPADSGKGFLRLEVTLKP